jgi:ParB family chromosome partitioning protein
MAKSGLGKGLGALLGAAPALRAVEPQEGETVHQISLGSIVPSPLQPRREFAREALEELVDSIRQRGIIQPLIVRPVHDNFELIAGERRWRAAKEAGLTEAPVLVRQATDLEVLELSLIENLQRADLNPIEEAQAYARLAGEFGMRQDDIAQKVGKSRASVANAMRLLDLDQQIQTWIVQDLLSVGHAKVLLGLKAHDEQRLIAEIVLRQSSTVRTTERMIARRLGKLGGTRRRRRAEIISPTALSDLENRLRQHLATQVTIHHGEKRGRIEIEFYGSDDLQRVLGVLGLPPDA